jgi:hypothetical protein
MKSPHPDTCAVIVDEASKRVIEIRKTVLTNQITRDADRIAKSFDKLQWSNVEVISEQFALCLALVTSGLIKASREDDDLRLACAELLSNSLNSLAAATHLLRGGFILQPGAVVRSSYESLAVVLHLMQIQADLERHRNHTFESTRALASAKRVFPPFGRMYGMLSEEFTHIGRLHKQFTPIREYGPSFEPLSLNMHLIRAGVWMCYVTSELAFLDIIPTPRYWTRLPSEDPYQDAYLYSPAPEEQEWIAGFLGSSIEP